ncbi:Uncharacterised protein [Mycobacteroides abscessus subsp. abscessus]|nr:Uncharacterised protein [Mycobacteroides abscessus subsp. abscessus]
MPESFRKIGAGFLPEVGPNTGFNNLTLLLGILAAAVLVWMTFRRRATQARLGAELSPLWADVVKLALIVVLLAYLTYLSTSSSRSAPWWDDTSTPSAATRTPPNCRVSRPRGSTSW